jgi:hypothetical protein
MNGPGLIDLDLNFSHDFALSKQKKEVKVVAVGLNSFNVLNHQPGHLHRNNIVSLVWKAGCCPTTPPHATRRSVQVLILRNYDGG